MSAPALSVVLATRSGWAPVRRTVECVAAQSVADRIELVLVTFGELPRDEPPAALAQLAAHRAVSAPQAQSVAEANAAGVRAAAAPVVVFGEDHAYPEPGWAEALLARHEEPWAVVGPVVRNANPETSVSWSDFVLGYAPFAEGHPGGEVGIAPGHNSSYKREVLLREGDGLESALVAEWLFHGRLRAAGERVYLEPRAVIAHVNFGVAGAHAAAVYRGARAGAAARARSWAAPRRAAYALGTPVLPPLRLARLVRALPEEQRRQLPRGALTVLVAALVVGAAGEAAGFARSRSPVGSSAAAALLDLELERVRFAGAAAARGRP